MGIRDFRLTFVTVQTTLAPLLSAPTNSPTRRLTDYFLYYPTFNAVRRGQGGDVEHPWRTGHHSFFWQRYFHGTPPDSLDGDTAWHHLIPFRLTDAPAKISAGGPFRVSYDCYGFPFGLALALTASYNGEPLALDAWVEQARTLRNERPLTIQWPDGTSQTDCSLTTVMDALMARCRDRYYGAVQGILSSPTPLSLMTVVQGDGFDLNQPIDSDLHRAIHAVTAWPAHWKGVTLPPLVLKETLLPMDRQNRVPGNCFYATACGRTVWMPSLFMAETPPPGNPAPPRRRHMHKLGCYHRNLVAGTVQTASLIGFCHYYSHGPGIDQGRPRLHVEHADILASVADRLADLYRGTNSYQSYSLRALIGDPHNRPNVDRLLSDLGHPPL